MGSLKPFGVYVISSVLCSLLSAHGNSQNVPAEFQKPEAVVQVGHRMAVRAIVFGADGSWLASGAKDNTVKIWDAASGRLLRTLYGHGAPVNALAVSPDGKLLASGSGNTYDIRYAKLFFQGGEIGGQLNCTNFFCLRWEDTSVRLWDVSSGRQLRVWVGHELGVTALAFSRDGRTLTSASSDAIKVWDLSSGNLVSSLAVFPVHRATPGSTMRSLSLFRPNVKDAREKEWEAAFKESASVAVISAAGQVVAVALPGREFHLFDPRIRQELRSVDVESKPELPDPLAFGSDGQSVAHVKDGNAVVLEVTTSGRQVWRSAMHGIVTLLRFTPDGKSLLIEATDGQARSLHWLATGDGKEFKQVVIHDERTSRLAALSPDGRMVATVAKGGHAIELHEASTGDVLRVLQTAAADSTGPLQAEAASTDTGLREQLIKLGLTQSEELKEAEEDVGDFSSVYRAGAFITFTSDGNWLLLKQGRPTNLAAVLWEASTGTPLQNSRAAEFRQIGNPDCSPDGRYRVKPQYGSADEGNFKQLFSNKHLRNLFAQRVQLLDAISGRKLHILEVGDAPEVGLVPTTGFSIDGSRIAVSGFKHVASEIYVFDTKSGKKLSEFRTLAFHVEHGSAKVGEKSSLPDALAVSRDGGMVAAGYREKIDMIDDSNGRLLVSIPHAGGVAALSFNADGRILAALGKDGDAYLFDARAGQLLATLVSVSAAADSTSSDWLVVTPDGKFDGSPAGWNQILWRFAADTFNVAPVETFFNEFYYPGLLADIIAGKKLSETRDFAQLDRRQPSLKIEMVEPSAANVNSRTVQVGVRVAEVQADKDHAGGSGVRDVRLFRNGSLVKAWRGDAPLDSNGKALLEITIPIGAGPNRLTAYAFNRDNIKSPDASLVLTGSPALKRSGIAYVLSVGINQYSNPDYNLKFAVADAEDVLEALSLQQRKVGVVGRVEVVPLLNSEATKENIMLALKRLANGDAVVPEGAPDVLNKLKSAQPEDEVFIYFAGHGAAKGQRFYLIPHDLGYTGGRTLLDQGAWESIVHHSISDLELEVALEKVDARDVLLVIDACNSGQSLEAQERRRGPMNSKGLAQLAYEKGMYVLTAAQGYQAALEVEELGHGLLTFAIVEEGLKTALADRSPKDGRVVAREWLDYATVRVPELEEAQIEAAQKHGRAITFVEDEEEGEMKNRRLQRPRVFYRREADPEPLIVAKP